MGSRLATGSRLRSVVWRLFRAQAPEARATLVMCWGLLILMAAGFWLRTFELGAPGMVGSAVVFTAAVPLFAVVQLHSCRGGEFLRTGWIPPVLLIGAILPAAWGTLSLALALAVAAIALQYRTSTSLLVSLAMTCALVGVLGGTDVLPGISVFAALTELAMYSVVLFAVTRLAVLLDDLHLTQEVHARRQIDLERERIGRDLHDLMGRTLVAASLRNQTALRTVGDRDPAMAARLEQLHETISRGQVQLRSLTSGPSIARLDDELDNARMLCERLNIRLATEIHKRPPGPLDALCGLVIRENITNVLKHSRASWCAITVDADGSETVITVTNNGGEPGIGSLDSAADSRVARAVAAAGGRTERRLNGVAIFESIARLPGREGARQ